METPRSPKWEKVERDHLAKQGWCKNCGGTRGLQVHHIKPFHLDPEEELNLTNLITLCELEGVECHLHVGHLGNWKNFNPAVLQIANSPKAGVPAQHILDSASDQTPIIHHPIPVSAVAPAGVK